MVCNSGVGNYKEVMEMGFFAKEVKHGRERKMINKEFLKSIKKEISKGCGNDYIDEETDFELMCGKHIWKDKDEMSQMNLCEWCQHLYNFVDKLDTQKNTEAKK